MMAKKQELKNKFLEGLKGLYKLTADERINIYSEMSSDKSIRGACNTCVFDFDNFRRKDVEVSEDGFVVRRKPKVFLSHSHVDKPIARKIYKYLEKENIRVWFDEAELRFGDSLISKLREAIDSVDILLAIISKNSVESEWVKKEVEIAMNQEIDSRRVKVIPLLCDPVSLPGFLIGKLYADLQTAYTRKTNLPKLAMDIKSHLEG